MTGIELMLRTQIQLTELQSTALRKLAARRHLSIAELIRQSIDRFLESEGQNADDQQKIRQRAIIESTPFRSGLPDLARNHDKYLVEAYSNGHYLEAYSDETDDA